MNLEELELSLEDVLSDGFSIKRDSRGQIVIYTGLMEDEDGDLVECVDEEEDDDGDEDEDYEEDGDFEPYVEDD